VVAVTDSEPLQPRAIEVGRNARAVEWLKAEAVAALGEALRAIAQGREDGVLDGLGQVVVASYLLARRLGLPYARLDLKIDALLEANVVQQHQLERWYGDMSSLQAHRRTGRGL
jgi:hypothetical protein